MSAATDDKSWFEAWAARNLARWRQDPANHQKSEQFDRDKKAAEQRQREQERERRLGESAAARAARRARFQAKMKQALADGLYIVRLDPGEPPTRQWFHDFLSHRAGDLRFIQCMRIGKMALAAGAEMVPRGHRNPAAYILNYARRVTEGRVVAFVTKDATRGKEHLIIRDPNLVDFADDDPLTGEDLSQPPKQAKSPETAPQMRSGELSPVGQVVDVKRITSAYSDFPEWREPGED